MSPEYICYSSYIWISHFKNWLQIPLFKSFVTNYVYIHHIDGLVQDWSNSIANALELLQSCTKPSISITT